MKHHFFWWWGGWSKALSTSKAPDEDVGEFAKRNGFDVVVDIDAPTYRLLILKTKYDRMGWMLVVP